MALRVPKGAGGAVGVPSRVRLAGIKGAMVSQARRNGAAWLDAVPVV